MPHGRVVHCSTFRAMRLRLMIDGAKSFIPLPWNYRGGRGTTSAGYCYAVWLRHMLLVHQCGLSANPQTGAQMPGYRFLAIEAAL